MPKRIMVIGDAILDEEVRLERLGPSAEGVPTYRQIGYGGISAGGAGLVARHCARIGSLVTFIHEGYPFFQFDSSEAGIAIEEVPVGRPTVVKKTRFYCGAEKVLKVNGVSVPRRESACALQDVLWRIGGSYGAVLACDNGHGMCTGMEQRIVAACRDAGIPLFVDIQFSQNEPRFSAWAGADEIFLNETEHAAISPEELAGFRAYHVKLGRLGSRYVRGSHTEASVGFPVDVVDTVGAGDAYLAAWAVHRNLLLANAYAALSCTVLGPNLPPDLEKLWGMHETFARFR